MGRALAEARVCLHLTLNIGSPTSLSSKTARYLVCCVIFSWLYESPPDFPRLILTLGLFPGSHN